MTRRPADILGPGGALSKIIPGYESRPQQVEMAEAVYDAFTGGQRLMADAPTGVGKSFGYLVPAALWALESDAAAERRELSRQYRDVHGRGGPPETMRVLVATSTIALQEQLLGKDLPLLHRVFPELDFAIMKGVSNYLCVRRAEVAREEVTHARDRLRSMAAQHAPDLVAAIDAGDEEGIAAAAAQMVGMGVPGMAAVADLIATEAQEDLSRLLAWADDTDTGDQSDLGWMPRFDAWQRVSVGPGACRGRNCNGFQSCFAMRARRRAREVTVVVANYAVVLTSIRQARDRGMTSLLADFDVVVFDEAHHLADVARNSLGFRVTRRSISYVARFLGKDDEDLKKRVVDLGDRFFGDLVTAMRREDGEKRRSSRRITVANIADHGPLCAALREVQETYAGLAVEAVGDNERAADLRIGQRQVHDTLGCVEAAMQLHGENYVYYLDGDEHPALCAAEIDPSESLRTLVWEQVASSVMTSATLAGAGYDPFEFVRREVGFGDEAAGLQVTSPFDVGRNAVLCIPEDDELPGPGDDDFLQRITGLLVRTVRAAQGRTLGLFTSYRAMNYAAERITKLVSYRVLVQGTMQRQDLVKAFRDDVCSVLLGTGSLWTGIDVPGESLSCVFMDKLPFPSPGDPVMEAIKEREPDSFKRHFIPRAVREFRQGFGRLIRSTTDRGAVVLCDGRVTTKWYGGEFLRYLPSEMQIVRRIEDIAPYLPEVRRGS